MKIIKLFLVSFLFLIFITTQGFGGMFGGTLGDWEDKAKETGKDWVEKTGDIATDSVEQLKEYARNPAKYHRKWQQESEGGWKSTWRAVQEEHGRAKNAWKTNRENAYDNLETNWNGLKNTATGLVKTAVIFTEFGYKSGLDCVRFPMDCIEVMIENGNDCIGHPKSCVESALSKTCALIGGTIADFIMNLTSGAGVVDVTDKYIDVIDQMDAVFEEIYGWSIPDSVRIYENELSKMFHGAISLPSGIYIPPSTDKKTIAHELFHQLQYYRLGERMDFEPVKNVCETGLSAINTDNYRFIINENSSQDFTYDGIYEGKSIDEYNIEQQATIGEQWWYHKFMGKNVPEFLNYQDFAFWSFEDKESLFYDVLSSSTKMK